MFDYIVVGKGLIGAAAKSSNEIGRLAAGLVENDGWTYNDFDHEVFKVRYQ